MRSAELIRQMSSFERKGVYLYSTNDLRVLFPGENPKTLEKSVERMLSAELLLRVVRGLYAYNLAVPYHQPWVIEDVAKKLRPQSFNYLSLESALSEWGVISQVPLGCLTVMTTGSSGLHKTPFGTIEFTHTKQSIFTVVGSATVSGQRPLPIATKKAAVRDLLRVGRNVNMIDWDEVDEDAGP